MDLIKLHRIATRVARRRVSLETILDEVKKNCPTEVVQNIGNFLGKGGYGEAYEVDGGDKVLKIGVAETDAKAEELFQKLEKIKALGSDVFVTVYDFGILCEVDMPQSKYMIKSGTAYYYVMERLQPIPQEEVKIASRTVNDLESLARKPNYAQERKKYIFGKSRQYKRDGDIEEGGVDPLAKAVDLFDRMQAMNVGHRDMHKNNIMQDPQGRYKLIDLEQASLMSTK